MNNAFRKKHNQTTVHGQKDPDIGDKFKFFHHDGLICCNWCTWSLSKQSFLMECCSRIWVSSFQHTFVLFLLSCLTLTKFFPDQIYGCCSGTNGTCIAMVSRLTIVSVLTNDMAKDMGCYNRYAATNSSYWKPSLNWNACLSQLYVVPSQILGLYQHSFHQTSF